MGYSSRASNVNNNLQVGIAIFSFKSPNHKLPIDEEMKKKLVIASYHPYERKDKNKH